MTGCSYWSAAVVWRSSYCSGMFIALGKCSVSYASRGRISTSCIPLCNHSTYLFVPDLRWHTCSLRPQGVWLNQTKNLRARTMPVVAFVGHTVDGRPLTLNGIFFALYIRKSLQLFRYNSG